MLVLTRKTNESIVIAGDIIVTVLEQWKDGTVRLGITADERVSVHREEVQRAIERDASERKGA